MSMQNVSGSTGFKMIQGNRWLGLDTGFQRDKTMVDKLMYIPNDDKQNYPFCGFHLMVETFGHLPK